MEFIRKRSFGTQKILFHLLLVVLVPVLFIQGYIHYDSYQAWREDALKSNLEVARATGRTFHAFVRDVRHQSFAIGLALIRSPMEVEEMNDFLRKNLSRDTAIRDFAWVNPKGRVTASSLRNAIGMDLSDLPYIRQIFSGQDWFVSDLLQNRDPSPPVFVIGSAARNDDGDLLGVVLAIVSSDRMGRVIGIERSGDAGVTLLDSNGMHVYRDPPLKLTWEERHWLKLYPVMEDALKGREVAASIISGLTGQKRLVAYSPVASLGWVAAATRSEDQTMESVVSGLLYQSLLSLLVTLTAFAIAFALSRSISATVQKLRNHALALGRGEADHLALVSGPAEFKDLADAFNQMADKVRFREEELRKSHAEMERRVSERTAELQKLYEDQKTYMTLLEQGNRELNDFVHVASHDLQEPVRKIQTFADRLLTTRRASLDAATRDSLERIQQSACRMQNLVLDLLQYSRLISTPEPFTRFDLKESVEEAISDLEVLRDETGGRIEVGDLPELVADRGQMSRLFQNLIGNGLKYRGEREPVVRVYHDTPSSGGFWEIRVEDNGIGFDERYLDRIFRPFQRLHGKNSHYQGMGMGLAICRRIVERHGGSITAMSDPGKGSVFVVKLPKSQECERGALREGSFRN